MTPLYVAEISPEALRGRLVSLITLYGTTGVVVSVMDLWTLQGGTAYALLIEMTLY